MIDTEKHIKESLIHDYRVPKEELKGLSLRQLIVRLQRENEKIKERLNNKNK